MLHVQAQEMFRIFADFARQFDDAMDRMQKQQQRDAKRQTDSKAHRAQAHAQQAPDLQQSPLAPSAREQAKLRCDAAAQCAGTPPESSVASNQGAPADSTTAAQPMWMLEAKRKQRSLAAACQPHAPSSQIDSVLAAQQKLRAQQHNHRQDRGVQHEPEPCLGMPPSAQLAAAVEQQGAEEAGHTPQRPSCDHNAAYTASTAQASAANAGNSQDSTPKLAAYHSVVTPQTSPSKLSSFAPQLSGSEASDAGTDDLAQRDSITHAGSTQLTCGTGDKDGAASAVSRGQSAAQAANAGPSDNQQRSQAAGAHPRLIGKRLRLHDYCAMCFKATFACPSSRILLQLHQAQVTTCRHTLQGAKAAMA